MKKKIHYAWFICASCTLLLFCTVGLVSTAFVVYQPYLISVNGFSNTQASLIVTVRSVFSVLVLFVTNQIIAFLKPKKSLLGAIACAAGTFLIYGLSHTFGMYCVGAVFAGIAISLGGMVLVSQVIDRWFDDAQGTALGICAAGSGMASVVVPPVITKLIMAYTLRGAFLVESGVILIMGLTAFLLMYNDPAEKMLRPYAGKKKKCVKPELYGPGLYGGTKAASMLCMLLLGYAGCVAVFYRSTLYVSVGFNGDQTAALLSLGGGILIIGKFLYGLATDKMGGYRSNYLFSGLLFAACVLECFAMEKRLVSARMAEIFFGFGLPVLTLGGTIVAREMGTKEQFAANVKDFTLMVQVGSILASMIPGILADLTGSYKISFFLAAIGVVLYTTGVQVLHRKGRRASDRHSGLPEDPG